MNSISYAERVEVYKEALRQNGKNIQMVVAMEELMECHKEISKTIRGEGDMDHLAEEIADATIMLEQLRMMHGINEMVCRQMDEKIKRLSDDLGMYNNEPKRETATMKWVPEPDVKNSWVLICEKCGKSEYLYTEHKYCPNCGAKFEGPLEEIPWRQEDGQND